ncbi:MAG TPA: thermonuclease family protein [Candidatus Eisenbacteria bacterium]|nr:thermonuclease family protein [Candidatus Eisenbacteria bacterium]
MTPNRRSKSSKNSDVRPIFLALFLAAALAGADGAQAAPARQSAVVREVLTGDTIRLAGGKTLRYIGVVSPPLQSKIPLVRVYGENALNRNRQLVAGKTVQVEWDSQIRDERNNFLAYVFLEDGTFVNEELLKSGDGRWKPTPPNARYAARLRQADLGARRGKLGLWKEEPENPFIKSEYIGDKNTKIYYYPTSPELERIPQSYLVTFASRVDAKAAGFKPCPTCREENREMES